MKYRASLPVVALASVALIGMATATGCSGCRRDPLVQPKTELDDELKKKAAPKEDFEIKAAITVPGEGSVGRPLAKPGHWTSVVHEVRANNFDFQARLQTAVTDVRGNVFPVANTPFELISTRPAPLPKGQLRIFESTYFIPRAGVEETVWLNRELRAARGGRLIGQPDRLPVTTMNEFQYFMVVLASDPDRYGYLKRLTAVDAPTALDISRESFLHYRVLLPRIQRIVPLPSQALTWTTIAYLVWDDLDSGLFTPSQEQALLDWLHWGGQVIISGPNSLDKLEGSFLEPYLPARSGGTIETDVEALEELNNYWAIADPKTGDRRPLVVPAGQPLMGVRLELQSDAAPVPNTGGLVVERRIGRGRIVVTSLSLTERSLVNWPCFDSFVNACLLRRPRRIFRKLELMADTRWADFHPALARDSRMTTTQRYFTRDIGHSRGHGSDGDAIEPEDEAVLEREREKGLRDPASRNDGIPQEARDPATENWHFAGFPARRYFGMAAWNDSSGASDAAREALRDAAGISIPRGQFVLQVLAIYLVVLVPLNWLVFRMMGRVEWAWLAAPLIAVSGAFAVIRFAQLDIGFARSVTEVAVAEMQGSYPRAHLTRYGALYTSLSTSYDIQFEDLAAIARPLSSMTEERRGGPATRYTVDLRRDRYLRMSGFRVPSNKTGIVHVEQYADLGSFAFRDDPPQGPRLENTTEYALRDAGVFRRTDQGQLEGAWIGTLSPATTAPLTFEAIGDVAHFDAWNQTATTLSYGVQVERVLSRLDTNRDGRLSRGEASADVRVAESFDRLDRDANGRWSRDELTYWTRRSRAGEVSLGQLIELASQQLDLARGEVRLLGWTDQPLPGMQVQPAAAQVQRRTMFLVHLRQGPLPLPRPDLNLKMDVVDPKETLGEQDLLDSGETPLDPIDDLFPNEK